MTEFYIEIQEETTDLNDFRPLEIVRRYVLDVKDAEKVYSEEIVKFADKKTKASFVEMNHDKNSKLNNPCISKDFKDGKVSL